MPRGVLYRVRKEEVCQCLQSPLPSIWKPKCYRQQKHSRSGLKTLNSSGEKNVILYKFH